MTTALQKVVAVLNHDADKGIRHQRLEVEPSFFAALVEDLRSVEMFRAQPIQPDGTPEPREPITIKSRLAVWGPHGAVEIVAK